MPREASREIGGCVGAAGKGTEMAAVEVTLRVRLEGPYIPDDIEEFVVYEFETAYPGVHADVEVVEMEEV